MIIIKFFKHLNIPLSQAVTLFAADKVITLFWYILFTLFAFYFARLWRLLHLPTQEHMSFLPLIMTGFAVIILASIFFARRSLSPLSARIKNWLLLSRAYISKAKKAIYLNVLITLVRILFLGCAFWVSIRAYGPSPSLMQALCFAIAAGLVAYIPISFNGLGTVETALIYLYSTIGIESAPVLSMALTMRLTVIIVVICCAIATNLFQQKLSTIH